MKSYDVTVQVKPLQQYFLMVLFIQYVVLSPHVRDSGVWENFACGIRNPRAKFKLLSLWTKSCGVTTVAERLVNLK